MLCWFFTTKRSKMAFLDLIQDQHSNQKCFLIQFYVLPFLFLLRNYHFNSYYNFSLQLTLKAHKFILKL